MINKRMIGRREKQRLLKNWRQLELRLRLIKKQLKKLRRKVLVERGLVRNEI